MSQRLPDELHEKISNFFYFVRRYFKEFQTLKSSDIHAADETSVLFENVASSTVSVAGEKTVTLKSTGHDKLCTTVMLSGKSSGDKNKPLVIFKGAGKAKGDKELLARKDIIVVFNQSGWCDQEVLKTWISSIFPKLFATRKLLIWDSFRAHTTPQTKDLLKERKVDSIVIPGGLTGLIQAPDVSWNFPFKNRLRELYDTWLSDAEKTYTKAGNMRAPSKMELCDFIVDAWNSIPKELIEKSFHATGQSINGKVEDIHALKPGNKAEEMFEHIQSFWNNSLEEFDLKVTENFRIAPSDNHNEGNELFLIDSDNETE